MPLSDYKRKQKMAERLRRSAEAFSGMQAPNPTVYTPGSGAFPGQVQANWLAPIAQMASAYAGKKMGERADTAEDEAAAARMQALQELLNPQAGAQGVGNAPGQPGTMGAAPGRPTAEQLMGLQDLGLDPSVMKMLMPKEQSLGAITQAAATPAGRAALVQMGVWTPEQAKQAEDAETAAAAAARQAEQEQYMFEQQNKRFAPTQSSDNMSEFEYFLQQNPGAPLSEFYAAKNAGKGGAGGGKNSPQEKAAANERALNILDQMEKVAGNKKLDTLQNKIGSVLLQSDNPMVAAGGTMALNAAGNEMRALQLDAALEEASKLTPVSNTDFKALMRKYESAILNPEEFKSFVKTYKTFLEKHGAGAGATAGSRDEYSKVGVNPDTGVAESTDSGWSVRVKGAQ